MMKTITVLIYCLLAALQTQGDILVLQTGHAIYGKIQSHDEKGFKFLRGSSTYTYAESAVILSYASTPQLLETTNNLPSWGHVIDSLATTSWRSEIKQIPSTVIDQGVLKNTPYLSFRCGSDYEINVYGDPENPACIEIGCYRSLTNKVESQDNCLKFISDVVGKLVPPDIIVKLNRTGEKKQLGEWVTEITPPSADDSYGGWWISIYSEPRLAVSQATPQEIAQISVKKLDIDKASSTRSGWSKDDLTNSRPAVVSYPTTIIPPASPSLPSSTPVYNSGGSVYVRGYTRKDGTYVQPHTRSSPRR